MSFDVIFDLRPPHPRLTSGSCRLDGAIAQLGERLLCKQEVVGSIPSGSTRLRDASKLEETWVPLPSRQRFA